MTLWSRPVPGLCDPAVTRPAGSGQPQGEASTDVL